MLRKKLILTSLLVSLTALMSSCSTAISNSHRATHRQFEGCRGKITATNSSPRVTQVKEVTGDVDDLYDVSFDPFTDVSNIVGIRFVVDTGELDWFESNCLQNNADCKDFLRMFGAETHLIGTNSGNRFVTVGGSIETGEVMYFKQGSPDFDKAVDALKAGRVMFVIRTNIAEKNVPSYGVTDFLIFTETRSP